MNAFCDLQYCPVSFDFVTWLIRAKLECGDVHVVIVPHETGLGGFSRHWGKHDEAAARWRLWHIVIPSCQLIGATVTLAHSREQAEGMRPGWWPQGKAHFMGPLVISSRSGGNIPRLSASDAARRYVAAWMSPETITLTVREQDTDSGRNSRISEWRKLAEFLIADGHPVLWLDDTHIALMDGRGYAELDVDLRLAVYERARMNLIGNNGPSELLKFSDAPYRIFLDGAWPEHFKKYFHMDIGDQLPWAGKNQRIVYRPDTFDVMREELIGAW